MVIQLVDRSKVALEEITKDVLIRISKFVISIDFIVLDYEVDDRLPIIFGCPSLALGGALVDVRKKKLKMIVNDEEVTFRVYKILTPLHYRYLYMSTTVK